MDSRERIDIYFDVIQKNLERRIGCNPDELDALDALWEVQTLRLSMPLTAACLKPIKNRGMITAGERTPNP